MGIGGRMKGGRDKCCVIVVGAGLGGLAVAIGMKRAGHDVTVLERMLELGEIGFGIQIPPNSSRILEHWGILDEIASRAVQPRDIFVYSYKDGRVLSRQQLKPGMLQTYGTPYLVVHRAELSKILLKQAKEEGVMVQFGSVIQGFDFTKPSVLMQDGKIQEADLIIGADGERSFCRSALLGHPDPPKPSGDIVFRTVVPIQLMRENPELMAFVDPPAIHYMLGPNAHALVYTLKEDGLLNLVLILPDYPGTDATLGAQPVDMDQIRISVKEWDIKFRKLLDIAKDVSKWQLVKCDDLFSWTHREGKLTLLGDSAHAMLPYLAQGAAQTFEDAAVLSRLLSHLERKTQIPDLVSIYEQIRKPRAMQVKWRSLATRDVNGMVDGEQQRERDRQLVEHQPFEGYPNPLADPVFSKYLFGYDAVEAADKAWKTYKRGEWPLTRGMWQTKDQT